MKPKVLVLKADGTNCDEEMAFAFKVAGGDPEIIHINELRKEKEKLNDYQILALPGGFAYGDDIVSGKILAIELTSFLESQLKKFIESRYPSFEDLWINSIIVFSNKDAEAIRSMSLIKNLEKMGHWKSEQRG